MMGGTPERERERVGFGVGEVIGTLLHGDQLAGNYSLFCSVVLLLMSCTAFQPHLGHFSHIKE